MSTQRWFFLGFFVVAVVVVLLSRTGGAAPAPSLAPTDPESTGHLQPELAIERPYEPVPFVLLPPPTLPPPPPEPPAPALPPLPPLSNATSAAEVRSWLEHQAARMPQRGGYSTKDPLIDEFAKVPAAYWGEMLAQYERFSPNQHSRTRSMTGHALIRSVQAEHRELVLANLAKHPFLIDAITAQGWVGDAADTMRRLLADTKFVRNRMGDAVKMVGALASLHDERDHAVMTQVLCDLRYGYWQAAVARSLAKVPGYDLQSAVRAAWRKIPRNEYQDRQDGFAVAAAQAGIAEALPFAVLHAIGGEDTNWSSGQLQEEARALLRDHFGVIGDADDPGPIITWWATAKDQVRWDEDTRRWTGPRPAPPPPVKPEPAPGANDF